MMVDRVLNDKEGKEVKTLPMPETAVRTEYEGKVYRRKETGSGRLSEDFYETDERSMLMRPLGANRLIRPEARAPEEQKDAKARRGKK